MITSGVQPRRIVFLIVAFAVTCSTFAGESDLPEIDSQQVNPVDESEEETDVESQMLNAAMTSIGRFLFGGAGAFGAGAFEAAVELVVDALDVMDFEDAPMDADEVAEQLRPLLVIELGFVRRVCDDLTVEQRAIVRAAAETSLKQSADELRTTPLTAHVVGVLKDQTPQPLSELRDAIANSLKQVLSEERFRDYAEISEARIAHRKQAAILFVVSLMDGALLLSTEQREELVQAFSTQWESNWEHWGLVDHFDQDSLPMIPGGIVKKILNDSQKSAWAMVEKSDVVDWSDEDADELFNDGWWGAVLPGANLENNEALEVILGN